MGKLVLNGVEYIGGGSGGGSSVMPNSPIAPGEVAVSLQTLRVDGDVYRIVPGATVVEISQADYNHLSESQKKDGSIYMVAGSQSLDPNYSYYTANNDTIIVRVYHEGLGDEKIIWFFRGWNQSSGDMSIPSNLTNYAPTSPSPTWSSNYPNGGTTQDGWIGFYNGYIRAWTQDLSGTTTGIMYGVVDASRYNEQTNPYVDDPYVYLEASNKIYYMDTEYATNGGGSEIITYETTITTTDHGWWVVKDEDGEVLDPDEYELINVIAKIDNNAQGSWNAYGFTWFINKEQGDTDFKYLGSIFDINNWGRPDYSGTYTVVVSYRPR